jgi:hypothetical protein
LPPAGDRRSSYTSGHDPGVAQSAADDLDAPAAEIASRRIEPAEQVTYKNGVRKAIHRDADGNEIGFGGAAVGR